MNAVRCSVIASMLALACLANPPPAAQAGTQLRQPAGRRLREQTPCRSPSSLP